jgi:KUP system potassium uptake protein
MTDDAHPESYGHRLHLLTLTLGALGIVYGDIGTSPLYAMRECFHGPQAVQPTPTNVLGILSLIVWSLVLVISIKYLVFVMRADNDGEGGILALTALVRPTSGSTNRKRQWLVVLGLFGAALFYGDGMITPAISVLSAVEGLKVATPFFAPYILPVTVLILIGLFLFQQQGTAGIGAFFGPVMLVWFLVLGLLGLSQVVRTPGVVAAINPFYAVPFFVENGGRGFLVLGAVFLVVTGGEALYADMGHFGIRPIRLAWFGLVLPALLLNYFGQGALLLRNPAAAETIFYHLVPQWGLYPLVLLATFATVIASQAVISGAFSLTRQAVQLGYSPRVRIRHTSAREIGQIYIPGTNWALMLACIGLVVGFRSSSNLAAAYGIAVTATMGITSLLLYVVARQRWGWSRFTAGLLIALFLVADLAFFGANSLKIPHGGWFPLVIAGAVYTLMATWRQGRRLLSQRLQAGILPLERFLQDVNERQPLRVPGTAVFLYGHPTGTPPALLLNLTHNKVLHERIVILTVVMKEIARVPARERIVFTPLGEEFYRIVAHYGFMESPDIPALLEQAKQYGVQLEREDITYFLGRETLLATQKPGMAVWRERLFAVMTRNAQSAMTFFHIPPERVVELGSQVEI